MYVSNNLFKLCIKGDNSLTEIGVSTKDELLSIKEKILKAWIDTRINDVSIVNLN